MDRSASFIETTFLPLLEQYLGNPIKNRNTLLAITKYTEAVVKNDPTLRFVGPPGEELLPVIVEGLTQAKIGRSIVIPIPGSDEMRTVAVVLPFATPEYKNPDYQHNYMMITRDPQNPLLVIRPPSAKWQSLTAFASHTRTQSFPLVLASSDGSFSFSSTLNCGDVFTFPMSTDQFTAEVVTPVGGIAKTFGHIKRAIEYSSLVRYQTDYLADQTMRSVLESQGLLPPKAGPESVPEIFRAHLESLCQDGYAREIRCFTPPHKGLVEPSELIGCYFRHPNNSLVMLFFNGSFFSASPPFGLTHDLREIYQQICESTRGIELATPHGFGIPEAISTLPNSLTVLDQAGSVQSLPVTSRGLIEGYAPLSESEFHQLSRCLDPFRCPTPHTRLPDHLNLLRLDGSVPPALAVRVKPLPYSAAVLN